MQTKPDLEPLLDFSPYRLLTEPDAVHQRMRTESPVRLVREESGFTYWLVSGYAEARQALRAPGLSNDPRRLGRPVDTANAYSPMANNDPPHHTRLRGLVSHGFTRRRINALAPRAEAVTGELLDALAPTGRADVIADLAFPLPVLVICELLGVPTQDRDAFRAWAARTLSTAAGPRTREERSRRLRAYFTRLVAAKRAAVRPGLAPDEQPDLLSALIVAQEQRSSLDDDELIGLAVLLLVAGHETTTNLIGNGLLTLLLHPDQLTLVRDDPALLPSAVEELLRYEGSAGQSALRVAVDDVVIGGTVIPRGSVVNIGLSLANRDPGAFLDADTLDVRRTANPHLAFGHGIHYCLGAPLARMLATTALGALLGRFGGLQLAVPADELRWRQISILCGLTALPISFAPVRPETSGT
ncbi:cytochrome P450 [Streptomyces puniciscabiei]|uniref:Cytochrome P450 n=1 Tax=Streptomyces puniciscabiei TaxID=164348 RepID=A0A542U865_9ACTN|nr:cytochrome P450 [Streptomyces puniciscabiei]TQK95277.1 cytochrome P450 [Streptomyces puniciscabiei]